MSEFNLRQKPSLSRAKAILREQWPEVIQFLGNRSTQAVSSNSLPFVPNPSESDPSP